VDLDIIPEEIGFLKGKNASIGEEYFTINNGRFDKHKLLNIEKFKGIILPAFCKDI